MHQAHLLEQLPNNAAAAGAGRIVTAIDLALSSAALNAASDETSGFGAPLTTPAPISRAMSVCCPRELPCFINSEIWLPPAHQSPPHHPRSAAAASPSALS